MHLHEDGVARVRITEVLEDGDGPRSTPRWTSDKLVLNKKEMVATKEEDIQVMSVIPSIQQKLSLGQGKKIQ